MFEDFFRRLSPSLASVPVAGNDKFWLDTRAFVEGGMAPLARQGSIKSLATTIVEWARDGLPDTAPQTSRGMVDVTQG